jgi:hypothetical protein
MVVIRVMRSRGGGVSKLRVEGVEMWETMCVEVVKTRNLAWCDTVQGAIND